jgi:hypothetical protein
MNCSICGGHLVQINDRWWCDGDEYTFGCGDVLKAALKELDKAIDLLKTYAKAPEENPEAFERALRSFAYAALRDDDLEGASIPDVYCDEVWEFAQWLGATANPLLLSELWQAEQWWEQAKAAWRAANTEAKEE